MMREMVVRYDRLPHNGGLTMTARDTETPRCLPHEQGWKGYQKSISSLHVIEAEVIVRLFSMFANQLRFKMQILALPFLIT